MCGKFRAVLPYKLHKGMVVKLNPEVVATPFHMKSEIIHLTIRRAKLFRQYNAARR